MGDNDLKGGMLLNGHPCLMEVLSGQMYFPDCSQHLSETHFIQQHSIEKIFNNIY